MSDKVEKTRYTFKSARGGQVVTVLALTEEAARREAMRELHGTPSKGAGLDLIEVQRMRRKTDEEKKSN